MKINQLQTLPRFESGYASSFINVETHDGDLIISQNPYAKSGALETPYIGRVYELPPIVGGGMEFATTVVNMFKNLPKDTILVCNEIVSPEFDLPKIYASGKTDPENGVLGQLRDLLTDFYAKAPVEGIHPKFPIVNRKTIILSVAIPVATSDEEEKEKVRDIQRQLFAKIKSTGFAGARIIQPEELPKIYEQHFNIYKQRGWDDLDEFIEYKKQFFGSDNYLDFTGKRTGPGIGSIDREVYCAGLTQKKYPREPFIGLMNLLIGAPLNSGSIEEGGGPRIRTPFIISTTIRIADQDAENKRVREAISSRTVQNKKFPVSLGTEDKEAVLQDLNLLLKYCTSEQDKYVYTSTNVFLYGKSIEEVKDARATLMSTLENLDFDVRVIYDDLLPRMVQSLPMNFSSHLAKKVSNEAIMPASSATCLLPIYGDWKGNAFYSESGNHGSMFFTRRGEPFCFDPFVSQGGFNGWLAAQTGAGKSVAMQYFVLNDLLHGRAVMLFDNGGSAKKLCHALGGDYNEFFINREVPPSLNPFTHLTDEEFEEESGNISSLMLLMAYERGEAVDPMAQIALQEAIRAVWSRNKQTSELSDVVDSLKDTVGWQGNDAVSEDLVRTMSNLVPRLQAFLSAPQRRPFFRGESTLDPKNRFTIFDLKGLSGDQHLHDVVMYFIMNTVMTRLVKWPGQKCLYVDEGKDVLEGEREARALEGLYRKARKDLLSVWFITQSPMDLPGKPGGEIILSQSEHKIVLGQEPSEIKRALNDEVVGAAYEGDGYFVSLIKDVASEKNVYSELLFMQRKNYEAVRLYLPELLLILMNSEGEQRDEFFKQMESGENPISIAQRYEKDKTRSAQRWIGEFTESIMRTLGLSVHDLKKHIDAVFKKLK